MAKPPRESTTLTQICWTVALASLAIGIYMLLILEPGTSANTLKWVWESWISLWKK